LFGLFLQIMEGYRKTILESGIPVITEHMTSVESVCLGLWIRTGSRDESASERGLSHFIEHMLFKGTTRRSALDISRDIESVGGSLNAYTGKEYTCVHVKVLQKDFLLAGDILIDMLTDSVFDPLEIDRERMVILQEIKMIEDTPDDYVHDLFNRSFWGDTNSLGFPICGCQETVHSFDRAAIVSFLERYYKADRLLVTAAGKVSHHEVVDLFGSRLACLSRGSGETRRQAIRGGQNGPRVIHRDLEQVHLCVGTNGLHYGDDRRYAAHVLTTLLGGNMSSRLFQEVREKRGLAYSIFSFLNMYEDAGLFGVYAGATRDTITMVVELVMQELREILDGRLGAEELRAAKEFLRGSILLGLESPDGRMSRLAKNEMYFGQDIPMEAALAKLEGVTLDEVVAVAREMFDPGTLCVTLLGPVREDELKCDRWVL